MKTKLLLIAMLAGIILFVACNDAQKSAADIAIKTAQGAYAVIADNLTRLHRGEPLRNVIYGPLVPPRTLAPVDGGHDAT